MSGHMLKNALCVRSKKETIREVEDVFRTSSYLKISCRVLEVD